MSQYKTKEYKPVESKKQNNPATILFIHCLLFLYSCIQNKKPLSYSDFQRIAEKDKASDYLDEILNRKRHSLAFFDDDKNFVNSDVSSDAPYYLTERQYRLAAKLERLSQVFNSLVSNNQTEEECRIMLLVHFKKSHPSGEDCLAIMAYQDHLKNPDRNLDWYLEQDFVFFTRDSRFPEFDLSLLQVNDEYKKLPVSIITNNKFLLETLLVGGYETIASLEQINTETLLATFFLDKDSTITRLKALCFDVSSNLREYVETFISSLKPKDQQIFCMRHALPPYSEEYTLEAIGNDMNVTRERIRQIDERLKKQLYQNTKTEALLELFADICFQNNSYISIEDMEEKLHDKLTFAFIHQLNCNSSSPILLHKLGFFYINHGTDPEDIINSIIASLPAALTEKQVSSLSPLEQRVVVARYFKKNNGILYRNNVGSGEYVIRLMGEHFPNGYHYYNDDDYEKLIEIIKNEYQESVQPPARQSIRSLINNHPDSFYECDKGAVKPYYLCEIDLPESLISEMIQFISNHGPVVNYSSIYETFKTQLTTLGIGSYYLLKGLLDRHLDRTTFTTKRNYIQFTGSNTTPTKVLTEYINKKEGLISLEELQQLFPGTKNYVFTSIFYSNEDYLPLGGGEYIHHKYCGVSEHAKQIIDEEIKELFTVLHTDVLSIYQLYTKLKIFRSNLFSEMGFIQTAYSLFSYCRFTFKSEYAFHRPFFSQGSEQDLTRTKLLYNHLKSLDSISHQNVTDYYNRIQAKELGLSYLDIMASLSDDYVQVSKETMIKKTKLSIPNYDITEIGKTIEDFLKQKDELNLADFKGYILLPTIKGLSWNQYLLAGILMSYFEDTFTISRTGNNIKNNYDYVVTKNKGATL